MASQNNLTAVFTDIANAIRDKKGSVDTIKPINMADEILTIETKSSIYKTLEAMGTNWAGAFRVDTSRPTLFYYMTELSENDIPPSSNVVNMSFMFVHCHELTTVPQLDTSSCTTVQSLFANCYKLTTVPQLDTSSATTTNSMFSGCHELTTVPQLDTSSCTDIQFMFQDCCVLEKIDITRFVSGTNYFAGNCYSLKTLIIRTMDAIPTLGSSSAFANCYHFYGTTDATYNPNGLKDGAIYVPDDKVASLKTAKNWRAFADIIKPLSEYVE